MRQLSSPYFHTFPSQTSHRTKPQPFFLSFCSICPSIINSFKNSQSLIKTFKIIRLLSFFASVMDRLISITLSLIFSGEPSGPLMKVSACVTLTFLALPKIFILIWFFRNHQLEKPNSSNVQSLIFNGSDSSKR